MNNPNLPDEGKKGAIIIQFGSLRIEIPNNPPYLKTLFVTLLALFTSAILGTGIYFLVARMK